LRHREVSSTDSPVDIDVRSTSLRRSNTVPTLASADAVGTVAGKKKDSTEVTVKAETTSRLMILMVKQDSNAQCYYILNQIEIPPKPLR